MYSVSAAYRQKMKDPVQRYRLTGQIIVGAATYNFTEENIIKKTFTLTNQCSGNDLVEIGSVYTAELTATVRGLDLPRYNLKNAQVIPSAWLWTGSQWEEVPLGVFWITEAEWTTWGVEITANDAMAFFDKEITWDTSYGTPWDFAQAACAACGVTLGMTKQQMQQLANGAIERSIYTENDMETWRDLIYWVGVTTGTFATIDRNGTLQFVYYGSSAVDQIDSRHRYKEARFSDFETKYTAVKITSLVTGKTKEFALIPNDGLTLDLGKNPLLQYGTDQEIETACRAILNKIAVIDYVPMRADTYGLPVYDLGDVLVFSDGAADQTKKSCITAFDWVYGGDYELTGVGQNPALVDARSKTDKDLQSVASSVEQDKMQFYLFTNAEQIHVGDGEQQRIIAIKFTSNKPTTVVFHAEILANIDTTVTGITYDAAEMRFLYRYNDTIIDMYKPDEVFWDGDHIVHLLYYVEVQSALVNQLEVFLEMDGGSVTIDTANIRSSVYGQALAATDVWDGTITIRQTLGKKEIGHPTKHIIGKGIQESIATAFQTPTPTQITETIPIMEIGKPNRHIIGVGIIDIGVGSWEEEKETGNIIHITNEETEE